MTVFVSKVTVVVEIAGRENGPAEFVAQFDGDPELTLFSEAGREVVSRDQTSHVDVHGDTITARRCFRSRDENLGGILQKFVTLVSSDSKLLAVCSTQLIERRFLVQSQPFGMAVISFVHPIEFVGELRVWQQRIIGAGKCVVG